MIAMKFTIELDIGLSFLLQPALAQLVTDRETKTHRRGRSKRSYGHCRRRTEIPEAEPLSDLLRLADRRRALGLLGVLAGPFEALDELCGEVRVVQLNGGHAFSQDDRGLASNCGVCHDHDAGH